LAVLEKAVLEEPGSVDPAIRRSAFDGEVPDDLKAYVQKVRLHAYKVTDSDIDRLLAAGYSEDQVFEITVATAVGAGLGRLDIGMRCLTGVRPPT
jgi:alkylhydroperoxidase family enzyme